MTDVSRGDAHRLAPGPVLISLAPAAAHTSALLRTAIDAEHVGARRIHLAADQPDLAHVIAGLRSQTDLIITVDDDTGAADLVDRMLPGFVETVLDAGPTPAALVAAVAGLVTEPATHPAGLSLGGRGDAGVPVLLAALAAGAHLRVGTADTPPPTPIATVAPVPTGAGASTAGPLRGRGGAPERTDVALVARAGGIARIAGRPPMDAAAARALWGIG